MQTEITILYEDEDLLAVNKPAGIHSSNKANTTAESEPTMLDLVLERYPGLAAVTGFHPWEPALLHRLDYGTSGLLLFAKNQRCFELMREQFSSNSTQKTYWAICQIHPEAAPLPANFSSYFLRCGPGGSKVRAVQKPKNQSHGRKCTADHYSSAFQLRQQCGIFSEVEVHIHRGFRHQIRVHLATNGYPIVGDELYNDQVGPEWAERLYLHAAAIDIVHPGHKKPLHIHTAAPWNFKALMT